MLATEYVNPLVVGVRVVFFAHPQPEGCAITASGFGTVDIDPRTQFQTPVGSLIHCPGKQSERGHLRMGTRQPDLPSAFEIGLASRFVIETERC